MSRSGVALPERIGTGADYLLRESAVDQRTRRRRHVDVGRDVWIAECRAGIPNIGHRRVVVDRDSVDEIDVLPRQVNSTGIA